MSDIQNLIDALDRLTAKVDSIVAGCTPTPPAEAPIETKVVEPKRKKKVVTLDDLRPAFAEYIQAKGTPAAKELLERYGAGRLTDLDEGKFQAFLTDLGAV